MVARARSANSLTAPDPAQVERFRIETQRLSPMAGRPDTPLALAVSGGPDSMAMLGLAHAAFPGEVIAATVDHHLRPESAAEAAMVAEVCARLGVPHAILSMDTLPPGNMHDHARSARYGDLGAWARSRGAAALATAHHADDQAETFLMRASRGSGPAGLASIRPIRDVPAVNGTIRVIRPLLGWRRAELKTVVVRAGIPYADDPSNRDERYERTRFRRLFEEHPWLDVSGIAAAAGHAAEADRALGEITDWLWQTRLAQNIASAVAFDPAGLPRELLRRMTRRAIESARARNGIESPAFTAASNIEPLLDSLLAGKGASHGGVKVWIKGGLWHFGKAPPRRSH